MGVIHYFYFLDELHLVHDHDLSVVLTQYTVNPVALISTAIFASEFSFTTDCVFARDLV